MMSVRDWNILTFETGASLKGFFIHSNLTKTFIWAASWQKCQKNLRQENPLKHLRPIFSSFSFSHRDSNPSPRGQMSINTCNTTLKEQTEIPLKFISFKEVWKRWSRNKIKNAQTTSSGKLPRPSTTDESYDSSQPRVFMNCSSCDRVSLTRSRSWPSGSFSLVSSRRSSRARRMKLRGSNRVALDKKTLYEINQKI